MNQFVAPRDSGYSIEERIDVYLDDAQWNPITSTHRPQYVWGLMMEYLNNVRGMALAQIMVDGVTEDAVYQEMIAWRKRLIESH